MNNRRKWMGIKTEPSLGDHSCTQSYRRKGRKSNHEWLNDEDTF